MSLSQATLSTELANLVPTVSEATAVGVLANAYGVYCTDATSNSVPISSAAIVAGASAMASALVGMSTPSIGAQKITQGCQAFWTAVAALGSLAFTGATGITPPPFATLQAQLEAEFPSITAAKDDLATAAGKIAAIIHAQTLIGGTVTYPAGTFPII